MNKMFYVAIEYSLFSQLYRPVVSVGAQLICFKLHFTRRLQSQNVRVSARNMMFCHKKPEV